MARLKGPRTAVDAHRKRGPVNRCVHRCQPTALLAKATTTTTIPSHGLSCERNFRQAKEPLMRRCLSGKGRGALQATPTFCPSPSSFSNHARWPMPVAFDRPLDLVDVKKELITFGWASCFDWGLLDMGYISGGDPFRKDGRGTLLNRGRHDDIAIQAIRCIHTDTHTQ